MAALGSTSRLLTYGGGGELGSTSNSTLVTAGP